MKYKFTFDVEATSINGQGFAVGWTVTDENGVEIVSGYAGANPMYYIELGLMDPWVVENVLPVLPPHTHETARDVRDYFWPIMRHWVVNYGAIVQADCAFPVETNFLADCIEDEPETRRFKGPLPLHEIGTVLRLGGIDSTGTYPRRADELPKHHPVCDSRQSARLEHETSRIIDACVFTAAEALKETYARAFAAKQFELQSCGTETPPLVNPCNASI